MTKRMATKEQPDRINFDAFTIDFMRVDPNDGAWEEGEQILDRDEVPGLHIF